MCLKRNHPLLESHQLWNGSANMLLFFFVVKDSYVKHPSQRGSNSKKAQLANKPKNGYETYCSNSLKKISMNI